MMCPKCRSTILRIRRITGIERILTVLTSKRKYLCPACGCEFRAPDRRKVPREGDDLAAAVLAGRNPR